MVEGDRQANRGLDWLAQSLGSGMTDGSFLFGGALLLFDPDPTPSQLAAKC